MRFLFYLILNLLILLAISSSFALDFREKLSGEVIKISASQNRFILARGTDDGVILGDIAKIFINNNIVGTAVVVDLRSNMSEWVFYQIYNWNHYTEGIEVEVVSLFGKNRPRVYKLSDYQKNSMLSDLLAKERKRREEEKAKADADKMLALSKNPKKQVLEAPQYGHTLPDFRLSLSLSPFLIRPHDRGKEIHYGLATENLDQRKEFYFMEYEYGHESFNSRIPNNSSRMSEYKAKAFYERKDKIFNRMDYATLFTFKKKTEGNFSPTHSQVRFGVLGFKYRFSDQIYLKYIPLKEYYSGDRLAAKKDQSPVALSLAHPNKYPRESQSPWRHFIEFYFSQEFMNQKLKFTNTFNIAPTQKFSQLAIDLKDLDLHEIASLGVQAFPNFMMSLISDYSWDMRRKVINDMPASEWGWRITLSYDMDFVDTVL